MRFNTRLVHSTTELEEHKGAASVPIYPASTFSWDDLDNPGPYEYSRGSNPTRKVLEASIAELEGGVQGFAYGSGMAAICGVFAMFSAGDHLIAPADLYGGTYRALTRVFNRFGIETSFVDCTDPDAISGAIRSNTRAIYVETPSNPYLTITDIRAVVTIAREHGILTIADNTFMTPYLQRPLELGCDVVVHSATKFLGGHSDVIAGVAAARTEEIARQVRGLQNALGGILGPYDSWLVLRGIKTLKVRVDQEQATAMVVAKWLKGRPEIADVYYPGLPDHPGYDIHGRQSDGPGAVLSFRTRTEEIARRLYAKRKLPMLAVSLGGVESILSVPSRMSHASLPPERRRELRIDDCLARLSVGLEDAEDLIADLEQAIES